MRRTKGTGARLWPDAGVGTDATGIRAVGRSAGGGPPAGRWPRLVADDKYAVLDRRRRRAQIAARHALDRGPEVPGEAESCRSLLTPSQGPQWARRRPVAM